MATFFCFAAVKLQISSTWTRFAFTLRTLASWKPAQKRPASSKSFDHRVDRHVREARDGAHRSAFAEHREDLGALGNRSLFMPDMI